MDRPLVGFGVMALLLGLGVGAAMMLMPEGLNPNWPMAMALLAPAAFVLAGLHMVASGLGYPRFSGAMLKCLVIVMWAVINWATFFTTQHACVATLSLGGVALLGWTPSESDCRASLQLLIASLDGLLIVVILVWAWRKLRRSSER